MKTTIKTALTLTIAAAMLALAACNTTKGAGRDIEKAGDAIEDSADRHGAD